MSVALAPCPFCGDVAEFERTGTRRQSCIVQCTECGTRHESNDEGERSGTSWNRRAADAEIARLTAELAAANTLIASYESPTCDHRHPCRCGSGGHPRRCERHPNAYDRHIVELNAIGKTEAEREAVEVRICTIADEAFGPFPVHSADEACTAIERGAFEQRARIATLERELAAARKELDAVAEAGINRGRSWEATEWEAAFGVRNRREAVERLRAVESELAAARAVPPDVEAAIDGYGDAREYEFGTTAHDTAEAVLLAAIARAISDATGTARNNALRTAYGATPDESLGQAVVRATASRPATVGGLLATVDPGTVTWRAPNPLTADGVLDWMHGDICEEFDEADDLADRMHALGMAKRERLDELLGAAWAQFVDEAGLTELHTTDEEVPDAR